MLYTWTGAAAALPKTEQPYKDWQSLIKQLELDNKGIAGRLEELDHLLDSVEEMTDRLSA
jgi:hypothetical protein